MEILELSPRNWKLECYAHRPGWRSRLIKEKRTIMDRFNTWAPNRFNVKEIYETYNWVKKGKNNKNLFSKKLRFCIYVPMRTSFKQDITVFWHLHDYYYFYYSYYNKYYKYYYCKYYYFVISIITITGNIIITIIIIVMIILILFFLFFLYLDLFNQKGVLSVGL